MVLIHIRIILWRFGRIEESRREEQNDNITTDDTRPFAILMK